VTKTTEFNAYEIASKANCAMPDGKDSPGAVWLLAIQDYINDMDLPPMVIVGAREVSRMFRGDSGGFNTDAEMWRAWVDLAGWTELDDIGPTSYHREDISRVAYTALGAVAYRVATALILERFTGDWPE
jgi:hypothetical protein